MYLCALLICSCFVLFCNDFDFFFIRVKLTSLHEWKSFPSLLFLKWILEKVVINLINIWQSHQETKLTFYFLLRKIIITYIILFNRSCHTSYFSWSCFIFICVAGTNISYVSLLL